MIWEGSVLDADEGIRFVPIDINQRFGLIYQY